MRRNRPSSRPTTGDPLGNCRHDPPPRVHNTCAPPADRGRRALRSTAHIGHPNVVPVVSVRDLHTSPRARDGPRVTDRPRSSRTVMGPCSSPPAAVPNDLDIPSGRVATTLFIPVVRSPRTAKGPRMLIASKSSRTTREIHRPAPLAAAHPVRCGENAGPVDRMRRTWGASLARIRRGVAPAPHGPCWVANDGSGE